jgi:ComF family protein
MGRLYGIDLQGSSYATADILVPVPLHPRRLKERGYNQSEWLARGIAESLNIPVSTGNLVRGKFTSTQTRKNRFERFRNVEGIFTVLKPEELLHKHVLLVDDVVTTGSTLESSAEALLAAGAGKVSIATLACAEI